MAEATTTEERIGAMAWISAAQALGFIVGPGMCVTSASLSVVVVSSVTINKGIDVYV